MRLENLDSLPEVVDGGGEQALDLPQAVLGQIFRRLLPEGIRSRTQCFGGAANGVRIKAQALEQKLAVEGGQTPAAGGQALAALGAAQPILEVIVTGLGQRQQTLALGREQVRPEGVPETGKEFPGLVVSLGHEM